MKRVPKAKKRTAPKKKTTAARKKKTLDKLNLADGQMEVAKVRELEEILGVDQMNVFKTNDIEVFKENLSEMSLSDIQSLAAEAGVFPGGNKMALKNRLIKEFISETKGRRYAVGTQRPIVDPEDPKFDKLKKLMSEGF
jgi:hypothetical protein